MVPDASHLANIERPEVVTRAILEHLEPVVRQEMSPDDPLYERGMRVRREVLGDDYVDAALERATGFTTDFQDLITRYAWGEIWSRPAGPQDAQLHNVDGADGPGQARGLELHVRAALRNGLSADEIKEVILHGAIYCGAPAANSAFAVAGASSPSTTVGSRREASETPRLAQGGP